MKFLFTPLLITASLLFCFAAQAQIKPCYLTFNEGEHLSMAKPVEMPKENNHTRELETARGTKSITILDGYRIRYHNKKGMAFVNMMVELCHPETYEADKHTLIENLRYINANSEGMETRDLIELSYNGYKIYGLSRATVDSGNTLGTFLLFPGDNTVVYFYFNNLPPAYSNFTGTEDYKAQRNNFIGQFTAYLNRCRHGR